MSASAVITIWLARTLRPNQVPCQRPSPSDTRSSGGSPFEKLATTRPVVIGEPQSSTARTSTGIGQLAGMVKSCTKEEKTGCSAVGVQPGEAPTPSEVPPEVPPAPGATTSST